MAQFYLIYLAPPKIDLTEIRPHIHAIQAPFSPSDRQILALSGRPPHRRPTTLREPGYGDRTKEMPNLFNVIVQQFEGDDKT